MSHECSTSMNPAYGPRPIRLAFAALFWRLFLGFTAFFALMVIAWLANWVPPGQWVFGFIVGMSGFTAVAFSWAAFLTLLVNIAVNFIVRPRLLGWLAPKAEEGHAAFHLEPREREVASTPAQMRQGKAWYAGCLVQTDRRLLFLPNAWDVEPLSLKYERLRWSAPVPAPRSFWGLVRDIPPRLEIAIVGDENHQFAMIDAPGWAVRLRPSCQAAPPDHSETRRR
jgi:hypothetical protein